MERIIKVAFIYEKSNKFLSGNHFDNTFYNFFMNALKRNERLEVTYFPAEKKFDTKTLKGKFDIILLFGNQSWLEPELISIQDLDIPVISKAGDPHSDSLNAKLNHEKYKINQYFGIHPTQYFYKFFPKNFKYKVIIFGLEPYLYQNVTPYNERIKDKILVSGATGNPNFLSRLINFHIMRRYNNYKFYKLRTECTKFPYVAYIRTINQKNAAAGYPLLLQRYAAAIAASSLYPVIKYWETTGAGCLTFMEITKKNHGDYLGYVDGETAIFINEKNYKDKFMEYLSDTQNPKWEKIANAGRKYALSELNNDKAVESLIQLMESYL